MAALAAGLVVAFALFAVVGLGPVPAVGIPAAAVMGSGLVLHRRPRPAGAPAGRADPWLLITLGVGILAFTGAGAGIAPGAAGAGTGLASAGLAAYPPAPERPAA